MYYYKLCVMCFIAVIVCILNSAFHTYFCNYFYCFVVGAIFSSGFVVGWLNSVGSRVIYELDCMKPVCRSHSKNPEPI